VPSFWRILLEEKEYSSKIGRLFGGNKLMLALGFSFEDNGSVLALRDEVIYVYYLNYFMIFGFNLN
jgi:hypothetical protein